MKPWVAFVKAQMSSTTRKDNRSKPISRNDRAQPRVAVKALREQFDGSSLVCHEADELASRSLEQQSAAIMIDDDEDDDEHGGSMVSVHESGDRDEREGGNEADPLCKIEDEQQDELMKNGMFVSNDEADDLLNSQTAPLENESSNSISFALANEDETGASEKAYLDPIHVDAADGYSMPDEIDRGREDCEGNVQALQQCLFAFSTLERKRRGSEAEFSTGVFNHEQSLDFDDTISIIGKEECPENSDNSDLSNLPDQKSLEATKFRCS